MSGSLLSWRKTKHLGSEIDVKLVVVSATQHHDGVEYFIGVDVDGQSYELTRTRGVVAIGMIGGGATRTTSGAYLSGEDPTIVSRAWAGELDRRRAELLRDGEVR